MNNQKSIPRIVSIWLFAGIVLLFVQVNIGGITRLTDSGLSITEWEVIKGTLPPLSAEAWDTAFDKYKLHASKQFEEVHGGEDMTMAEFKVIYFWSGFIGFGLGALGLYFYSRFYILFIRSTYRVG